MVNEAVPLCDERIGMMGQWRITLGVEVKWYPSFGCNSKADTALTTFGLGHVLLWRVG